MKPWARIVAILVLLAALTLWLLTPNNRPRRAVERTRQALRQQGFKVDLSEFDLSVPARLSSNNELLMLAGDASRDRNMFAFRRLDLMRPVGSNSAMVSWSEENPDALPAENFHYRWSELREAVAERHGILDQACEALISTPFQFKTSLTTNSELAPDVIRVRQLGSAMAVRTLLALHEQHHAAAWTNLLALTRLVTAWQTEPMEISHSIRFRWVATAHRVIWEALQAKDWSEEELAALQHEWESPNFFTGLAESAALARAVTIEFCDSQRRQPPPRGITLREFASELVNSPGRAFSDATSGLRNARYRNYDSYQDEMAWLLFFRDCEVDYRKSVTANSWFDLENLSSATNFRPIRASESMLSFEALRTGFGGGGFPRQGPTLLARAAEADARRRLIVTAIAISRFQLAKMSYPDSLSDLVPNFLKSPPKDFIDGELLRYRRTDDGRFLLYSIGLDGIDDHGRLLVDDPQSGPGFGRFEGPDLVWPLPATPTEIRAYAQAAAEPPSRARSGQSITPGSRLQRPYRAIPTARTNGLSLQTPSSISPKL